MTRTKVGAIEHLNPIKWGKRAKYLWNETFFNKNVKLLKNYVLIEYKNTAQTTAQKYWTSNPNY